MRIDRFFKSINESVLDPIHNELSKDLWTPNKKLKRKPRQYILDQLEQWLSLYTDQEPERIMLAGSMTGYQYTEYSDIDVNVIIDLPDNKIKELAKFLPNGNDLPGTEHPVNYYITNKFQLEQAGSIYDIEKDEWMKPPTKKKTNIHYKAIFEITLSWMRKIDLDVHELERDVQEYRLFEHYLDQIEEIEVDIDEIEEYLRTKESEIKADIDVINITYHMIKRFRQEPFKDRDYKTKYLTSTEDIDANYTINNLVYKTLERFNYLDKLHDYGGLTFEEAIEKL